jgi:hypothetical protein
MIGRSGRILTCDPHVPKNEHLTKREENQRFSFRIVALCSRLVAWFCADSAGTLSDENIGTKEYCSFNLCRGKSGNVANEALHFLGDFRGGHRIEYRSGGYANSVCVL